MGYKHILGKKIKKILTNNKQQEKREQGEEQSDSRNYSRASQVKKEHFWQPASANEISREK